MATAEFPAELLQYSLIERIYEGEHWTDAVASETLYPGDCIAPTVYNGVAAFRRVRTADVAAGLRLGVALRTIDTPDSNTGLGSLGPNQVRSQPIKPGEFVNAYFSGSFATLVSVAASYNFGDVIGWDLDGARAAGLPGGAGAWNKVANADTPGLFQAVKFQQIGATPNVGLLFMRSLQGQH